MANIFSVFSLVTLELRLQFGLLLDSLLVLNLGHFFGGLLFCLVLCLGLLRLSIAAMHSEHAGGGHGTSIALLGPAAATGFGCPYLLGIEEPRLVVQP